MRLEDHNIVIMKAPDANAPCQTIPIAHLVRNSVTTGSIEDLVDSTAPKQTTTTQLAQDGQKIIVRLIARSPTTKSRQTYLIRFSNDDQACQFTEQLYRKLPPSITKPKPRLPAEFQKIYEQAKRSTRERSVGSEQLNDIDFDAIIDAAVASRISNISVYEASKTANDELNEDQAQDRSSGNSICFYRILTLRTSLILRACVFIDLYESFLCSYKYDSNRPLLCQHVFGVSSRSYYDSDEPLL